MTLWLGMQCVYDRVFNGDADGLERLAKLVTDPRWAARFKLINIGHVPGRPLTPVFGGIVSAAKLSQAVREALTSPSTESVLFGVSRTRQSVLDTARFYVQPGRPIVSRDTYPFTSRSKWMVPAEQPEPAARAWLELQHEIVALLGAAHGVIVPATDDNVLGSEIWLGHISINGREVHPDPGEISSYAVQRSKLGAEYIRAPRWGTYLKPAHVAAVGGRDKILAVVKPPVVLDVGQLLYVQLSARVADALAPATEERRRAFAELVAPITMPRLQR